MSALAIVSVMLVAGAFHAGWNLVAKWVSADRMLFLVAVGGVTTVLLLPWALTQLPATHVWLAVGFVVARGVANAVYIYGLSRCYQTLDLSLAYPLVRGIGPLVATLLAVLVLGERPALVGVLGVLVSSLAIGSMALTARARRGTPAPAEGRTAAAGAAWVVATGVTIGGYTVLDKAALQYWDPVAYLCFLEAVTLVLLGVPLLAAGRARALGAVIRRHPRALVGCALCVSTSYLLALVALQHAYASYIAPLREVSVLFGAVLGLAVLHEDNGRRRIPAALGIVVGLALVGFAL